MLAGAQTGSNPSSIWSYHDPDGFQGLEAYCISSVLIGSLNFGSQLMLRVTLYGHALRPVLAAENCC